MKKLVPLSVVVAGGLVAAACGGDATLDAAASDIDTADLEAITITLVTHDSFAVTDGIFDSFTDSTGVTVEIISGGDAGEIVSLSLIHI